MTAIIQHIPAELLRVLTQVQQQTAVPLYLVGGFVRDVLLDRSSKDIDFVVEGDPHAFCTAVAAKLGIENIHHFKHFGTCMFRFQNQEGSVPIDIEFVMARKESYEHHSRKPQVLQGTLAEDLGRRDFTINALAVSLNEPNFGELIDLFGGVEDLKKSCLRTPLDPHLTYSDDPLRMMRAIRFAAQLNFSIEEKSWEALCEQTQRLSIISQERITDEFNKIMLAKVPSVGMLLLYKSKLLHLFFPELVLLQGVDYIDGKGHKDNFYHTLQVVDNIAFVTDSLWLRWAALLHDIAKPATKKFEPVVGWTFHGHEEKGALMVPKIFKQLKLPLDAKMRYVRKLVRLHLRPIALVKTGVTDSAARRLLFEAGEDFEDLMKLCYADITSKNEGRVERIKGNFNRVHGWIRQVEEQDQIKNFQPPIDGEEIMLIFALNPCKEIGIIKNWIKNAILDGEIPNTYDAAYALLIKKGLEFGFTVKNTIQ